MKNIKIDEKQISIIGMGNGGHAFAAYAKSKGYSVNIWNRTPLILDQIKKKGGITSSGLLEGHFEIDYISTSLRKVIEGSKLIMITTTANAHKELTEQISSFLHEDQIIVLNPGRTGGALEVSNTIQENGGPFKPQVIEAQSLLFVSRSQQPGEVTITGYKNRVPVSAFPSCLNDETLPYLQQLSNRFFEAENILNTSFDNIGAIFHPAPLLLNVARCEDKKVNYRHYIDGVSPSVASFLENMDKERLAVAAAFGVNAINLQSWLNLVYGSEGDTLFETIRNTKEYFDVLAPNTLNVRYIFEDIPTGLVPLSSFGELAEIPTPFMDTVINLASCMFKTDYRQIGRTLKTLNLEKIPPYLLQEFVTLGDDFYIDILKNGSVIEE